MSDFNYSLTHEVNGHSPGTSNFDTMDITTKQPPSSTTIYTSPVAKDACVHDLIQERGLTQPEAPAICAWDGQFTYSELDTYSSSFGASLANNGVAPEVYVPICLEKSKWVPVAMLGVLKASGAFVLLDPSHPIQRMQEVCGAVRATMIITSGEQAADMAKLGLEVVVIDGNTDSWPEAHKVLKEMVTPSNAAYSMFTSGTSGVPKGVVIEHRSFSTSALAHSSAIHLNSSSRVLQFSSLAFDVSITEILTTLIVGGCVCIPSEIERKHDLAGASRRLGVTFAIFTPSLARVLEVQDFPMLETLALAGEAVQAEDVQKWAPHVKLFGAYGPTECAVLCMVMRHEDGDEGIDASNIGHGVGVNCWVVDPDDHNQLWPTGAVGELLLDGPSVSRGYINDPGRTGEVFIDPPAWHQKILPHAVGKLYKTGDLVSYDASDGSIRYVGRKDNQVKVNGQRLELVEVETHIRRLFEGILNVVVELVTLADKSSSQILIAFVLMQRESTSNHENSANGEVYTDTEEKWFLPSSEAFLGQVQTVQTKLRDLIPQYMVPTTFLPVRSMPLSVSGKSDRRLLRSLAADLTWNEMESYKHASAPLHKRQPSTAAECQIQRLWATVLQIPIGSIGADDSFLDLGGDSLAAIKLAGAARRERLELTVGQIYGNQTLSEMALAVSTNALDISGIKIAPFSLLSALDDRTALVKLAMRQCQLSDAEEVDDIYPCTPLQEGLIALTAKRPGAYTVSYEYELPVDVNIKGFQKAWDEVIEANPILRTRIIQADDGLMYQVVVQDRLSWESLGDNRPNQKGSHEWKLGQQLVRLYINQRICTTEPYRFVLALHHSITDGWAIPLLLEQVEAAYRGISLEPRPFNGFIEYISRTSHQNETFWNRQFADLNAVAFPPIPSLDYVAKPSIKKTCVIPSDLGAGVFSVANKIKLAWGILLSLYTESPDVVFGAIVTGRGAPVFGVEEMTGPTIATIPVRLLLNRESTIAEALEQVQRNFITTIPFEQAGLQHIRRMGLEAAAACQFQSLLVVQLEEEKLPTMFSNPKDLSELSAFTTYAITLNCQPSAGNIEVEATFDPRVLSGSQVDQILNELQRVFEQMTPSRSQLPIRDLVAPSVNVWPKGAEHKLLRTIASELSRQQHGLTGTPTNGKREATTDVQRLLHELFAEVIKIPADELSIDDNFFRLGGDSIMAMNLVTRGKDRGLIFTVADVFENPAVISLAEKAQNYTDNPELQALPFALIKDGSDTVEVTQCAIAQCEVDKNEIDDIYPCTPLQEGLMTLTIKNPGMYIARFEYLLPRDIDLKRFQKAWGSVCKANSILRTRIIQSTSGSTFQVVLSKPVKWDIYTSHEEEKSHSDQRVMSLGGPLMHMALVPSTEKGRHKFIWTIHHALYDGWTLPLLWTQVKIAYEGRRLQPQPFNRFIQYLTDVDGGDEFWTTQLSNLNAAVFPPLPYSDYSPNPHSSFTHTITNLPSHKEEYTLSSVIQLAWALVLAHYTDSEDVVYGLTVNGRTAPVGGITEVTGPTIATIPFRVSLSQDETVRGSLFDLQRQGTKMIPFLQHGLQNIRKLSVDTAKACEFQTHLGIQPSGIMADETLGWLENIKHDSLQGYEGFVSYAFTMICHMKEDSSNVQISVNYDSSVLENAEARRLVQQFQAVVRQLSTNPESAIREIQVISDEDMAQLTEWNGRVPLGTHETLHDLVLRHASENPNAEAVSSWDGKLTYCELDDYSGRLAQHLLEVGISSESRVAVCLEKSRWSIVAMLAVLRAGATVVLLDPNYPRQRMKQLINKTTPQLLLASEAHENLVQGLDTKVILIGDTLIGSLAISSADLPEVLPSHPAFILFTSGSTGQSKAIIMEHVNLSTSICAHSSSLNLDSTARSLHFASYAFDASIYEIFETLICGGCLCIPSEYSRLNDLAGAIREFQITWAVLTRSTLNLFKPEDVPSLKTLVVAGDTVTRSLVNKWASKVTLINAYGPAEGTCCTVGPIPPVGWHAGTIGHMLGSVGWLVSPSDPSKLAAIGSVGELIIEGSVVTKGYLGDPEKTAAAYIDRPAWLQTFRKTFGTEGASTRLYKTGDLLQYNTNGTIRYIGRKDTQVKRMFIIFIVLVVFSPKSPPESRYRGKLILKTSLRVVALRNEEHRANFDEVHGQRIELEEVEYHVHSCFPRAAEVIAEMIRPRTEGSLPLLIVCIWLRTAEEIVDDREASDEVERLFILPDESFRLSCQEAETRLLASAPAYMVPSLFLPLRQVPLTRSGKVDRRRLRETCSILLADRIHEYTGESKVAKRAPSTTIERTLHEIWARVLNRQPESFGIDDSFFRIGGDSISAMQVVAQCAAAGFKTSVAAMFEAKTVALVSLQTIQMVEDAEGKSDEPDIPFDLTLYQTNALEVEDAYPCTPIQEGMLISQAKDTSQYFNKWHWSVHSKDGSTVNPDRLMRAWRQVVQKHPLLRTEFHPNPSQNGSHDQLVLRQAPLDACEIIPTSNEPLKRLLEYDGPPIPQLRPQSRLTICGGASGDAACLLDINHTVIDGISAQIIMSDLRLAYDDQLEPTPTTAYREYVKYINRQSRDDARSYWKNYLQGAEPCFLPKSPTNQLGGYLEQEQRMSYFTLSSGQPLRDFCFKYELTMASVFQLGWALVLRTYLNDAGSCFGYITSGRDAPIPGIDNTVGPFINMLICHILPQEGEKVLDILLRNQNEFVQSLTHQHLSLAEKIKGAGRSDMALFNTAMSVLKEKENSIDESNLDFKDFGGDNPTEYDLTINIELIGDEINIALEYFTTFISDYQAKILGDTFQQALLSIISGPQQTVSELNMFGDLSRERVGQCNTQTPTPVEECLHNLVHERCLAQPSAPAVCAWDGDFTYAQLDKMSSIIASDLIRRGVGSDQFVPLCFEKSRWTVIALLGIVKAGGAFVLLDPSFPALRLQNICRDIKASLILTSESKKGLAATLGPEVVVISNDSMPWTQEATPVLVSTTKPNDALYAVFTSGSSGKPKGAVIEHRSFITSARAHSAVHQMTSDSRVLQYTSYAWDVNIVEQISTLLVGGCICVPSDAQRQEDFAETVAAYNVNWAFLTPSMSRIMDPSKFKTLRTLVIGGDVISAKELGLWRSHVNLFLIYGPSETSVFCSSSTQVTSEVNDGRNLGHFHGCNAWVVNPRDHNTLVPIGAVGELLIEGPIVGRGYLNDPAQNALAFISAPSWRSGFAGNCNNRFYKTGDLVRYVGGGERLQFVGRKDFQVKLRGQRIELGEIEQYLSSAFENTIDAVAEIIKPDGGNPMLVAFVCQGRGNEGEKEDGKLDLSSQDLLLSANEQFCLAARTAELQLSKTIPAFMVPVVFFPVRYIPRTTQNKTDRWRLREAVKSLTFDDLEKYNSLGISKQQPSTEGEVLLQQVWARVLNKAEKSIGVHDSFFRLGGDSISAMQVASQSSAAGMSVTVADIFRCKTISQLDLVMKKSAPKVQRPEISDSPFSLSPIQNFFFQLSPHGCNEFNQDFFLRLTRSVSPERIADAIHNIVRNHSMLRARFSQDHLGTWMQTIGTDTINSYHYEEHTATSIEAADVIFSSSQKKLNISSGPVFSANLINVGDEQYLFLTAHHLVVDLVSWRIILGDLEDYLTTGEVSCPPSMSFQTWCRLQEDYAKTNLDPKQAMLEAPISTIPLEDYWGIGGQTNLFSDVVEAGFTLDEQTTSALFQDSNTVFQTQPVELFQAAIFHSFMQTFSDRPAPAIWNEGHGREPWDSNIDVARTVGWFTTMWPLHIQASAPDIRDIVRQVKDKRRSIPRNGWAHFASSLHPNAQGIANLESKEILFNYIGQYQQLERSESLFHPATRPQTPDVAADMQRFALLEISVYLNDDCLRFDFYCNKYAAANRPISNWVLACERTLKSIATDFPSQSPKLTLSDFPLMPFTYNTIDRFMTQTLSQCGISSSEIEDIYPCSPIQRGILLSQAKNSKLYHNFIIWKIHLNGNSTSVDIDRVIDAWRLVISRHTILRTVFIKSATDSNFVDQVVLKTAPREVCVIPSDEESRLISRLSEQRQLSLTYGGLPHRFSVGQTLAGEVLCALEINHAIFDGTTLQILQRELQLAYDGSLTSDPGLPYHEYISFLSKISESANKEYWATYLEGVTPCLLPIETKCETSTRENESIQAINVDIGVDTNLRSFCNHHQLTLSNLFQVAWGLVLKSYVGSDSVVFGYLNSGRDISIPRVEDAVGPFINGLVCYMDLSSEALLIKTLQDNQASYIGGIEHQHCSLTDIISMANLPSSSSLFNTLMSLQVSRESSAEDPSFNKVEVVAGESRSEYDLTLNIVVASDRIGVTMSYWKSTLSEEAVRRFADAFRQAIHEIINNFDAPISSIQMLGEHGRSVLQNWNKEVPVPVGSRVDDLIQQRCLALPNSTAVCAWDGDFTYGEMDTLSSKLAGYLHQYNIQPDTFVPICFEKSRWTTIAIMGVIKAGGAFILLDPSHPVQRLQEIYNTAEATLVISSECQSGLVATFAQSTVIIGNNHQDWTTTISSHSLKDTRQVTLSPKNALYAVFTSGSTGKPKGIIIEHQAFVTSAMGHSKAMHWDATSRVLQFASYAFDVSVAEHLTTLLVGGCICVPSDIGRNDLSAPVARMRVNWAHLTPSIAKILNPVDLPSLRVMVVGGESISEKDLKLWQQNADLYFSYGPSECSVFSTTTEKISSTASGRNMGLTFGCRSWIVDPHNHEKLSPIGAIGELLIEGPTVARSYLKDPAKTKESFIQAPAWLEELGFHESFPIYKTGDLVKYNNDGTLYYISRKDTQAKLRGQRLELEEVEYHLRRSFPNAQDAVAEVINFTESNLPPALMAFISFKKETHRDSGVFDTPNDSFKEETVLSVSKLDSILPIYMVPTIFIPLNYMPLSKTGKTDRRALRVAAGSLTRDQIAIYTHTNSLKRAPTTIKEEQFQRLFADLFGLDMVQIGVDDHFFRLGGDSIMAMKLIPIARDLGYVIDIADVFNHPKLCDLAAASRLITSQSSVTVAPYSLIGDLSLKESMIQNVAERCQVPTIQIEDIYPCTPLQEGLVALAIKTPGHYVATFEYDLSGDIDLDRFQMAWNATVIANPILRTRIVSFETGIFQVVVDKLIPWNLYDNQLECRKEVEVLTMEMGEELVNFGIVRSITEPRKGFKFHLTLHHALYDGSTLPLLWSQVQQAYNNKTLPSRPFNGFIKYIVQSDGTESFWKSEYTGLSAPVFPILQSSRYIPSPTSSLHHVIADLGYSATKYTMSTLIRMAWAVIMSSYTDSEDVVYGMTVNGRSAPIPGIEQLTGPTIATFPMRIRVNPGESVEAALSSLQQNITNMIPYQQTGLQNIRQFSEDTAAACSFQCHLGIQPPAGERESTLFSNVHTKHEDYGAFANYALVIICHLPEKGNPHDITIAVSYDESVLQPIEVTRMMHQFEGVLRQLADSQFEDRRLDTLDLLCPQDREQISHWNSVMPSPEETCLHDLVLQHSIHQPDSPAISSWDGDLTFRELESACYELAAYLKEVGVQPGSSVPLCFDRSKWSVIAMIAALQVGAACVCLDPAHPKGRIQEILKRTGAKFVLTSPSNQHIVANSDAKLITVPITDEEAVLSKSSTVQVSPHDVAFIVFTSGSTGTPKGVLLEHVNLATSIRGYSGEMQINQHTRGLHFASYAFDASIYEIFGTLINGGCLCIPSEYDRMNHIELFINEYQVNWAFLTPSLITLMRPESIPGVRTIVLGGEAITQENVRVWASKVTLINGYGPAESTVCAVGRLPEVNWKQGTIGRVTGGVGWITMPNDPSRLAPIGAVGELLIEGAVVSRGYLHDAKSTTASFITNPAWHGSFQSGFGSRRLYRSGDLFQYNPDGTIRYIGRRDTQVKLRGQRIELGEIEANLKQLFPDALDVVAEVVISQSNPPSIVAFIANGLNSTTDDDSFEKSSLVGSIFSAPSKEFLTRVHAATAKLRQQIPEYMVPALFLQLPNIPRTSSDKADRKKLREHAAALSRNDIREFSALAPIKRKPATEKEKTIQGLWAEVFKVPLDQIGTEDDFFRLGGDSIIAMKMAGLARRRGLRLNLSSIFGNPVLSSLAELVGDISSADPSVDYRPGSLLDTTSLESVATSILPRSPHLFKGSNILDILPTTEFQNQLVKAGNVTYSCLQLPTHIDPERIEAACHMLLHKHAVLRTMFVPHEGDILQVVLRTLDFRLNRLRCDGDLMEFANETCSQDAAVPITFGTPYFQPFLISGSESNHILILRMTHAQYDGVSLPIIWGDFISAYKGNVLQPPSLTFSRFMRFRMAQKSPETYDFWRQYLLNSQPVDSQSMGVLPKTEPQEEFRVRSLRDIPIPNAPSGITLASLIRAAWSMVLIKVTKQRDVVFGNIINGRDLPLKDIESLSGPTVTISPFRATIQENWTVKDLLDHVQSQYTRTLPFANIDPRDVIKNSTTWAPETKFGSILTHQNVNEDADFKINGAASRWSILDFGVPTDFHVVTWLRQGRFYAHFSGSSKTIRPEAAEELIDQFCEAISEFAENPWKPLLPVSPI